MLNHSEYSSKKEPIAIIGIGCRFPGGANNPESFWKLLQNGVDAITEVPADRWNIKRFYDPNPERLGKIYTRWGGFVEHIDQFDPQFFGISPREAANMDPQHRMLLEVAWEALEDGGQVPENLAGSNTGVFIGISHHDYSNIQGSTSHTHLIDAYTGTGNGLSIAANRISYVFDFKGPSIAVDTACSSSLVALHIACRSIWNGDCRVALAGGVNALINPKTTIGFCRATMLSPKGRCRSFDAQADGFVRAEGAGIIILKPLSQALTDGDTIYAVIKSSVVNQDGHTTGITVPNGLAQETAVREALQQAGISPQDIQYVEAHGTGTAVGDPIEANALGSVFGHQRPLGNDCLIGSVKSNIGHLESAAGIAGLIKVTLALQHRLIPPNLHFDSPNPKIPFDELHLRVPTTLEPWPTYNGKRIAGINSFGFGGTNAHVVLAEAPKTLDKQHKNEISPGGQTNLLPISARSPEALQAFAQAYKDFLTDDKNRDISLTDICYSASLRRGHHNHRLALVGHSKQELAENLEAFIAGENRLGMSSGQITPDHSPKLAFVFSGMGQQWWAMGRQLLEKEPIFRERIVQCDALLRPYAEWSLLEELTADEEQSRINDPKIVQSAIFSVQVALAALWRSWGIIPDAIVGHSVGEVAAAQVAGVLSLEDAVRVIFHRSRLQAQAAGQGKMLAVALSVDEATTLLAEHQAQVSIAAINSHNAVTLSGDAKILEKIATSLEQKQIFCRFLRVIVPYHSPLMEPLKSELISSLQGIKPQNGTIPLFSTVTGKNIDGSDMGAAHWAQNIREPVLFSAAINGLIQSDHHLFLEIGAHPVLSTYIYECLANAGREGTVLPSLRRKEPESVMLLGTFGQLYTLGYTVDWHPLYPSNSRFVRLPSYPWQREHYWQEYEESQQARLGQQIHPLLGNPLKLAQPVWNAEIDLQNLSYLRDHCVQGAVVYPGAAYVEMALAALKETFGEGTYVVEDIAFQKMLILPEGESTMLQFILEPDDNTFRIYSRQTETSWVQHATGKVSLEQNSNKRPKQIMLDHIRSHCLNPISKTDYYEQLHNIGYQYGSYFQGIEQLWLGDGETLAKIWIPENLETNNDDYLLAPVILDACLQVIRSVIPLKDIYLPVLINRIRIDARLPLKFWLYARLTEKSATHFTADAQACDDVGNVLMEIQGNRGQLLKGTQQTELASENYLYEYQWQWQARPGQENNIRSADYLPTPQQMAERLQTEATRLSTQLNRQRYYEEIMPQFNALSIAYVLKAFQQLGWKPQSHQRFSADTLAEQLSVAYLHRPLLGRMLEMLQAEGVLTQVDKQWEITRIPKFNDPQAIWKKLLGHYPAYQAELMLMGRCGQPLAEVLRDQVDPLQLVFPQGALTISEHLYQDSPTIRIYNLLVQKAIAEALTHLPAGRTVRILEIGAGTAGITSYVLPKLPIHRTEYVFTDISQMFTSHAEQKFRDYPFVQYQILDIEKDPIAQGFEAHSFDLILASDALHATRDLRQTLEHVKQLLASEGLLVLLELGLTNLPRWFDIVFGLLKGWWLFVDRDLRPSHPLLSVPKWQHLFKELGFGPVADISDLENSEEATHTVFLAKAPVVKTVEKTILSMPEHPGRWLIFADNQGVGQALAVRFKKRGETPIFILPGETYQRIEVDRFQIRPAHPEDMQQIIETVGAEPPACRGIVHLWSLDTQYPEYTSVSSIKSAQSLGCLSVIHLVQALVQVNWSDSLPLWLVTQGVHTVGQLKSVSIAQSPLWGLGRVIINEQPNLRTRMVDISPECAPDEIQSFFEELGSDDQEDEIALRGKDRYVHRLMPVSLTEIGTAHKQATQPFRLEISTPGILDNLTLRATTRKKPVPGEIEIQVCATALNFKDVAKAMGLLSEASLEGTISGRALGIECSGKIVAIGEGVTGFQIGDEVIAMAPHSFSTYITTDARLVVPKPTHLSFEEAATISVVFLTAYYALHHLARLGEGERVLIHAAAGGVGLAAIQLAQSVGAEIFATAGTPEKREFLRALGIKHVMDSRTLAFADQVMERTGGKGVDVVLNSLAGKAIPKSLSILSAFGRFIEIGKRDIEQNRKLDLLPFQNNLSFFAVDLDKLTRERPEVIRTLWDEVMSLLTKKTIHPLPHRVFPISEVIPAFRYMAEAKHIGKIVVSLQDPEVVVARATTRDCPYEFRADGTYFITGGLGGFGLAVAQWLVENGARHLVLMGRHGAFSQAAKKAVKTLEEMGAEIVVAKADVTKEQDVARVIAEIKHSMPPLRGVIHAATVWDDAVLLHLNEERLMKVMGPKTIGAWHLHTQTLNTPLDLFVLFSSLASTFGNPGQGNYAAANAFLDTLAHYRHTQGLPVLTINWGAIAEVGYVAQHAQIGEHFNKLGVTLLPPQQALKILGELLRQEAVQASVTPPRDLQRRYNKPATAISPRLTHLVGEVDSSQQQPVDKCDSLSHILVTDPTEGMSLLESMLREQVAKVLSISTAKLDIEKSLTQMGLDSLMAVELSHRFKKELNLDVSQMTLLRGHSIIELAEQMNEQLTEAPSDLIEGEL